MSTNKRKQKADQKEAQLDPNYSVISDSTDSKTKRKRRKRKTNKSIYLPQADEIDLAKRRDVVNKTILRALRRYYAQKLKENSASNISSVEAGESKGKLFKNI